MKTKMQRLQSRISKRRNAIRHVDSEIEILVTVKNLIGLSPEHQAMLTQFRKYSKDMGVDQKLDKELYQMLLEQERNKFAGHFRSKYKPVGLCGELVMGRE
jgi:hypothetical protein